LLSTVLKVVRNVPKIPAPAANTRPQSVEPNESIKRVSNTK